MAAFSNAVPRTIARGINDLSGRPPIYIPESVPTHLLKLYTFAQEGPTHPQLVVGASRDATYGSNTFDERSKYATHVTVLANTVNKRGNFGMYQRVIPKDAAPRANMRLLLDVMACKVDDYARNEDNSLVLDKTGNPIPNGTKIDGYSAKWVTEYIGTDPDDGSEFGKGNIGPGDQTDAISMTQSKRYPLLDFEVAHIGEYGNNIGLRMWAPTIRSSIPVDTVFLQNEKAYPFRIACIRRENNSSTANVVQSNSGGQFVELCFKPGAIDHATDREMYLGTEFIPAYQTLDDPDVPPLWGPFGQLHVYEENLEMLLGLFCKAELSYATAGSDLTGEDDEAYRFNIISGLQSDGTPYRSFQLVRKAQNSLNLGEITNVFATGGSDGTMSDEVLDDLVSTEVAKYADLNSELMDDAVNVESILYDSGFALDAKYALINFIALRKDTAVVLSTTVVGGKILRPEEESALAVALRTRLQMFPESSYYGTSTVRGVIVGRSGKLINSRFKKRLPITIELADKAAAYMGAANGKWKSGKGFDRAPGNMVTMFSDINSTFTPTSVRNKDWANGMMWVESFDRRAVYFPSTRTVYNDDTSILTSFTNMMIAVELQKVGLRAQRQFSGSDSLTDAQLIEGVQKFIVDNTIGRFDNRVVVRPEVQITEADKQRGYSWTTDMHLYGPNQKTVQTLTVNSHRLSDLTAPA